MIDRVVEQWLKYKIKSGLLVELIKPSSIEINTPEGRAKERIRRATLTAIGTMIAKGINALTVLISVPLTVNYLGAERYGMWMTIS